ncbi:MAG: hypothetical protein M5U16_11595 [Hyphomicrobium sp.]|nr:hypothetical protein [Hyphomicrobium sp.]
MIKPFALALAAAIAVPVYSGPAFATDYWDWSMGSGSPTTRAKRARVKYARRYHKEGPTKVMAYVKREGEKDEVAERREFTCAEKVRGSARSGSAPKAPWTPPRRIGWSACATTTASRSST